MHLNHSSCIYDLGTVSKETENQNFPGILSWFLKSTVSSSWTWTGGKVEHCGKQHMKGRVGRQRRRQKPVRDKVHRCTASPSEQLLPHLLPVTPSQQCHGSGQRLWDLITSQKTIRWWVGLTSIRQLLASASRWVSLNRWVITPGTKNLANCSKLVRS